MPRVKQRTPELRDRVLQTAVATLAEAGVTGLTARRVAEAAETSVPAVYELFGDKGGLVRAVYFEGFRRLRRHIDALPTTDDPRTDLIALMANLRVFVRENPVLGEVMFARPFADFNPGEEDLAATRSVREFIVGRVRRCVVRRRQSPWSAGGRAGRAQLHFPRRGCRSGRGEDGAECRILHPEGR